MWSPFQSEHADQLIDARLRSTRMGLQRRRVDRLPGRNCDQRCAGRIQKIVAAAKHVERSVEVDIHHRAECIGRHAQHRREEIAGRARHDNVHLPKPVNDVFHRTANGAVIAHVR